MRCAVGADAPETKIREQDCVVDVRTESGQPRGWEARLHLHMHSFHAH